MTTPPSWKDRLAGYIYWKSRDYFDQAALVCRRQSEKIDWNSIQQWCQNEGRPEVFDEIKKAAK